MSGVFTSGKLINGSWYGQGTYGAVVVKEGKVVAELGGKSFYTSQIRAQIMGAVVGIQHSPIDEPFTLYTASKLIPRVVLEDVVRAKETKFGKKRRLVGSKKKHYASMDLLKQLDIELEKRPDLMVEPIALKDAESRFWVDYANFLTKVAQVECDPRMEGVDDDARRGFDAAL